MLPYPRVNLRHGVLPDTINETCTAGAGSLLLEFGILTRLAKDIRFDNAARSSNGILWAHRNRNTNLLGNVIDIQTGEWKGTLSGVGAGIDSFYEYLLKSYIIFGIREDFDTFEMANAAAKKYLRHVRTNRQGKKLKLPFYINVDMRDGKLLNNWVDSLQVGKVI